MANKELASLLIENNIVKKQKKQGKKINALLKSETKTGLATNITDDLGDLRIGNLLCAASGYPDDGTYTGTFISLEGFTINGVTYHIGGMKDGVLMWAGNSGTGKFIFCGGNAWIDNEGMAGTKILKYMAKQISAFNASSSWRMGFWPIKPDDYEAITPLVFQYENYLYPDDEKVVNGSFLDGYTGWTKTTETKGKWIEPDQASYWYGNNAVFEFDSTQTGAGEGVLTSDRILISASLKYLASCFTAGGTDLVELNWYDANSGGSLLRTDTIYTYGSVFTEYHEQYLTPPVGAKSAEYVLTVNTTAVQLGGSGTIGLISLYAVDHIEKLWLGNDGIGASGVTADTDSALSSGVYTPTTTAGANTNVAAATFSEAMWTRIGDVVHVAGYAMLDPTADANTVLSISLPIASNFTDVSDCAGTGKIVTINTSGNGAIYADTANDLALIRFVGTGTTSNQPFTFHFMYKIK